MPKSDRVDREREYEMAEAAEFLRRSSIVYMECAVSLMLTHMSVVDVISVLRSELEQLQEE